MFKTLKVTPSHSLSFWSCVLCQQRLFRWWWITAGSSRRTRDFQSAFALHTDWTEALNCSSVYQALPAFSLLYNCVEIGIFFSYFFLFSPCFSDSEKLYLSPGGNLILAQRKPYCFTHCFFVSLKVVLFVPLLLCDNSLIWTCITQNNHSNTPEMLSLDPLLQTWSAISFGGRLSSKATTHNSYKLQGDVW